MFEIVVYCGSVDDALEAEAGDADRSQYVRTEVTGWWHGAGRLRGEKFER
jgi:hypothetical protein